MPEPLVVDAELREPRDARMVDARGAQLLVGDAGGIFAEAHAGGIGGIAPAAVLAHAIPIEVVARLADLVGSSEYAAENSTPKLSSKNVLRREHRKARIGFLAEIVVAHLGRDRELRAHLVERPAGLQIHRGAQASPPPFRRTASCAPSGC